MFVRVLFAALALAVAAPLHARQPWVVLKNCRLERDDSNDADSFHVKAGGKEYVLRLYFVDAAETEADFPERIKEQGKYFRLNVRQTLQLGAYAKRFTKEKMTTGFTVRTCMQDALGRSKKGRFYAFIETKEGDLAELLVANGLARVHGSAATPEGLSSPQRQWRKLQRLEREAKRQKVGAWGATVGRMTARLATQPSKTGPDSFDAFFHPERVAQVVDADAAEAIPSPTPLIAPTLARPQALVFGASNAALGARLDVNTASTAELMKLPGIGPVLAERILAARPFKRAEHLRNVKGIGPKKYAQIRPHFDPPPVPQAAR